MALYVTLPHGSRYPQGMANDSPLPLLALAGAGYLLWKYLQPTSPAPSIPAASPISSTPTIYGASNPSYGSYQQPNYQQPSYQAPPQSSAASLFQSFFPNATTTAPPQPPLTYWNPEPIRQPATPPPPIQQPAAEPLTMLQLAQRQYVNPTPEQIAAVTADATGQVYNPPAQAVNCPAWLQWFQKWTYITGEPKPGAPPPPSC